MIEKMAEDASRPWEGVGRSPKTLILISLAIELLQNGSRRCGSECRLRRICFWRIVRTKACRLGVVRLLSHCSRGLFGALWIFVFLSMTMVAKQFWSLVYRMARLLTVSAVYFAIWVRAALLIIVASPTSVAYEVVYHYEEA